MITLNDKWKLACDPGNKGRKEKWFPTVRKNAELARVPGIIQEVFPDYHGVAWYWTSFRLPREATETERVLIKFGAVDYLAEVWVNGKPVGGHECGETPFTLDVTDAVHDEADNLLAVRVLNPTNEPIDGIKLDETPHRNKVVPHYPGTSYNHGGIIAPVDVHIRPAVRIEDLFAQPETQTGVIRLRLLAHNDLVANFPVDLAPGETSIETEVSVGTPHLWELNDPFLYRVTARVQVGATARDDELSARSGFRDFRFEKLGS